MRNLLIIFLLSVSAVTGTFAQAPTATLSGKVIDQTGAVIPQATVMVTSTSGKHSSATTNQEGAFEIRALEPGTYNVAAHAQGFATFQKSGVELAAGQRQMLNLALQVQVQEEKVNVQADDMQLDVSSASNASSLVIKGKDLEALSDDPDELQNELQALAGPAAGPEGGQIYIDGFTGGQLPPKSAIREIRINQNPFSAQYDKLGYGRIEILTKPGSDHYHGQFFFNDTNAVLNSKNPYVPTRPDYNSEMFDGNLGGPINKKASFFLDASRRNVNEFSAINATILDANNNPLHLQQSLASPRTRTNISPRLDYQLTANNTLTMRYQLSHDTDQNSGLGPFSLATQATNANETEHTLQISDTQVLSPKIVNETRFQFQRDINHQTAVGTGPTIEVQGAFTSGENSEGLVRTTEDSYELQNYTSITHGNHLIKFGARLRGIRSSEFTESNFNGTFIFSPVFDSTSGSFIPALTVYQNELALGCPPQSSNSVPSCPAQFSITTGSPQVSVGWFDAGLYAEDEWRAKPNLSFTYGLRYESQNNIHDHADFAPRLGVAWGLGGNGKTAAKTVIRAGFGIFYDRFGYNLIQEADLLNGVTQQSAVVKNPQFFTQNIPSPLPATAAPTVYRISPDLRAPYTIQSAASIERQITKNATVSVTYLNSRGEHAFYIDNINAPVLPGGGGRNGTNENIYQYTSGGVFRQNQLMANIRVNTGRRISLFGFYVLNYANSNASSGGSPGGFFSSGTTSEASFISNQYDPLADYGRAAFDVRHRVFLGGNFSLPYSFSLSPFVIINSGQPYNLTTGQDNNGDSIFNDRPWFATNNTNAVCTSRTSFSTIDTGLAMVPVHDCTGPSDATLNLRLSKTIGFGRETKGGGGGGDRGYGGPRMRGGGLGPGGLSGAGANGPFGNRGGSNRRYSLTFSISVRNLLNTFNPGPPVGNLSSPFFGQSINIAGGPFASGSANRRVDLQVRFSF